MSMQPLEEAFDEWSDESLDMAEDEVQFVNFIDAPPDDSGW